MCTTTHHVAILSIEQLQRQFTQVLPRIQRVIAFHFRAVRCATRRAECVAEAIGLAWKWFTDLIRRNKDPMQFITKLACFAARAVKAGRRVVGMERASDVMSATAQQRHGFTVEALPTTTRTAQGELYGTPHAQKLLDVFEERLRDNSQTTVPEQAAFRIDWPRFFATLPERDRRLAESLSLGHAGKKAARKFGLTEGRVSQLRRSWQQGWNTFEGEPRSIVARRAGRRGKGKTRRK